MGETRLLLESAAKVIAVEIKARWKCVLDVKVRITKMSPPITGIRGVCSVEYHTVSD